MLDVENSIALLRSPSEHCHEWDFNIDLVVYIAISECAVPIEGWNQIENLCLIAQDYKAFHAK